MIAGVGNCAGTLVQGVEFYRGRNAAAEAGLMHEVACREFEPFIGSDEHGGSGGADRLDRDGAAAAPGIGTGDRRGARHEATGRTGRPGESS